MVSRLSGQLYRLTLPDRVRKKALQAAPPPPLTPRANRYSHCSLSPATPPPHFRPVSPDVPCAQGAAGGLLPAFQQARQYQGLAVSASDGVASVFCFVALGLAIEREVHAPDRAISGDPTFAMRSQCCPCDVLRLRRGTLTLGVIKHVHNKNLTVTCWG